MRVSDASRKRVGEVYSLDLVVVQFRLCCKESVEPAGNDTVLCGKKN